MQPFIMGVLKLHSIIDLLAVVDPDFTTACPMHFQYIAATPADTAWVEWIQTYK